MTARRFPLMGKALALLAVTLGLLLALDAVSGLVKEREGRLREAEAAVADSLAGAQHLLGPVLQRVCVESWPATEGSGAERRQITQQHIEVVRVTPLHLGLQADARIETRHRGLFKIHGYATQARLQAGFPALGTMQPEPRHPGGSVRCQAPTLWVAVSDVRGIRQASVQLGGQPLTVHPGSGYDGQAAGFQAPLPESVLGSTPLQAEVTLDLLGTASLAVAPIGEQTEVQLRSDWPHPSFAGRFLPTRHEVTEQGFQARWQLSALATSAAARTLAGAAPCRLAPAAAAAEYPASASAAEGCVENFGVHFIDPVSPYVMSDRATKYGLLFIVLTFVGVGLVEVLRQLRVHPIQYLLVGCAIAMFFLLLVSLSEHLAFGIAYAAASAACTLLLGFYGRFVLHSLRGGLLFGTAVALLYASLYGLLMLEQSALVLGSLGLFAVLAVVMAATRRIDWYALLGQWRSETAPASARPLAAADAPAHPAG